MSAGNLETTINVACRDLSWIAEALAKVGVGGTLSADSNLFFQKSTALAVQLEHAKGLVHVRKSALGALKAFPIQKSKTTPDSFLYQNLDVSYKNGRHLLLQNYMITTWSIYDTVAKVAGILCCTDTIAKNLVVPVKLCEHLLRGKDCVGVRIQDHLKGAYNWPIAVSYGIRNWIAHDGHSQNGIELFKYDSPVTAAEFEIRDDAWEIIEKNCNAKRSQTRRQPFPDIKTNLVEGLEICHDEADEAVSFLLKWSTRTVRLQVEILFERDTAPSSTIQASTSPASIPAP